MVQFKDWCDFNDTPVGNHHIRVMTGKPKGPLTRSVFLQTAMTGIIALAFGMTLLLFALSGGKVGIVSTLSATTPVIILPMLWLRTREVPAPGAWAGAALVVAGMASIFWR